MSSIILFCLFFLILGGTSKPLDDEPTCGYETCPYADPSSLNVHIVPHSHDDVGWLKTLDQYYFQDVQNVLSSVIVALKLNPERRFVQVETAFFKKWWEQQKDSVKEDVIKLVNNGQLEIINGAWSMNDEAAVYYQYTIDQYTLGLRYLEDELGKCSRPRVGWQIDPFGHSREQASISAQMGFDSLFFARLDYRDKENRLDTKTGDLIWRGSSNLGNASDIFTSVLYNHYSAPSGFCFDIVCDDEPIIDDEESPDYNYRARVEAFADFVRGQAARYPTNNLIVVMGDDFRYQAALNSYINTDRLILGKMAPVAGTYQHVRNENFAEYLIAIGTPEDKAKAADALKPKVQVVIDGNTISLKSDSGVENASSTLVLGQEVDETLPNNLVLKSTATLDGDTLTIKSKSTAGKAGTRIYKFTDTEMTLTLTTDGESIVGKRFYKRV